jgi:hypothetical protein
MVTGAAIRSTKELLRKELALVEGDITENLGKVSVEWPSPPPAGKGVGSMDATPSLADKLAIVSCAAASFCAACSASVLDAAAAASDAAAAASDAAILFIRSATTGSSAIPSNALGGVSLLLQPTQVLPIVSVEVV